MHSIFNRREAFGVTSRGSCWLEALEGWVGHMVPGTASKEGRWRKQLSVGLDHGLIIWGGEIHALLLVVLL